MKKVKLEDWFNEMIEKDNGFKVFIYRLVVLKIVEVEYIEGDERIGFRIVKKV